MKEVLFYDTNYKAAFGSFFKKKEKEHVGSFFCFDAILLTSAL